MRVLVSPHAHQHNVLSHFKKSLKYSHNHREQTGGFQRAGGSGMGKMGEGGMGGTGFQ